MCSRLCPFRTSSHRLGLAKKQWNCILFKHRTDLSSPQLCRCNACSYQTSDPTRFAFRYREGIHTRNRIPAIAEHLILAGDIRQLTDYTMGREFERRCVTRRNNLPCPGQPQIYGFSYPDWIKTAKKLMIEHALLGRVVMLGKCRMQYGTPNTHITIMARMLWSQANGRRQSIR